MTSTVTQYSTLIDTTFPVPGVDNDTQGFRNNFGNITNALNVAASEISDLQLINSALLSLVSSPPLSSAGQLGDIAGQVFVSTGTVYICTQSYVNTFTSIWAKISCTPW